MVQYVRRLRAVFPSGRVSCRTIAIGKNWGRSLINDCEIATTISRGQFTARYLLVFLQSKFRKVFSLGSVITSLYFFDPVAQWTEQAASTR